jgi:hypothetical protein
MREVHVGRMQQSAHTLTEERQSELSSSLQHGSKDDYRSWSSVGLHSTANGDGDGYMRQRAPKHGLRIVHEMP